MNKNALKWSALGLLAGAGLVLLDALYLEQYFFRVKKFDIGIKRGRKKLRLLLLTDMHLKKTFRHFHARLAKRINQMNPHLILISGDMLDDDGTTDLLHAFLSRINHHIPKVAILGNHDHRASVKNESIKQIYQQYNCRLLVNESKAFELDGVRMMVTGLDDFIEGAHDFEAAVKDVGYEEHHLMLVHSPLQQEEAIADMKRINEVRPKEKRLNISYIFAGHNHGGQVRFFGYAPVLPEMSGNYVNGWYNKDFPLLYISKGFGTTSIPFRFGARSEVTLFNYYV
jgi:predicted MPP superfamily phosphohydrolase